MTLWEKRGTEFELAVIHRLNRLGNCIALAQFPVYSYSLCRSTPIDVLVMVGKNIFVLELKGISTSISGSYSDRTWVGVSGMRVYYLFNPIFQAKEKMRCLQHRFRAYNMDVSTWNWEQYVVVPRGCEVVSDRSTVVSDEEMSLIVGSVHASHNKQDEDMLRRLMNGGS